MLLIYRRLLGRPKIFYLLTPPRQWTNIGDHAQALAIRRWIESHFPGAPLIELDKNETDRSLWALRRLCRSSDLILLHSGGNLGDRGMWSERIRRRVIESCPDNRIVSLPQTIFFSDSEAGRREREATRSIYARHPRVTIMARDIRSAELADELFPRAERLCVPDFVLGLKPPPSVDSSKAAPGGRVLLCLRNDSESLLTSARKNWLLEHAGRDPTVFDTTLPAPIPKSKRQVLLDQTLELFSRHSAVVTDRFHGIVFAVLCRVPCIALPTVDHKMSAGAAWFDELPFVRMASAPEEVPALLAELAVAERDGVPDWNAEHFDKLPAAIDPSGTFR